MKLVVEIPEEIYKLCQEKELLSPHPYKVIIWDAVANGTPLPKGHGRLIDETKISLRGIHFKTELDHAMMIGRLNTAPTIIEAENEVENGNDD